MNTADNEMVDEFKANMFEGIGASLTSQVATGIVTEKMADAILEGIKEKFQVSPEEVKALVNVVMPMDDGALTRYQNSTIGKILQQRVVDISTEVASRLVKEATTGTTATLH